MAFQRREQILAPGGLNLLASPDLASGTDSIALKNFRSDGSGVLRSRLSANSIGINFAGNIHTIYRSGNDRYFGVADTLYLGAAAISIGYDSGPLSLATMQDFVWVMNRAKQARIRGGVAYNYLSAPPSAFAHTAAAGGSLVDGVLYSYWTTFVQSDGSESNPSDPWDFTPGSGNNSVLFGNGTPSDPLTTHWNLYRIGNTLDAVYRVNPEPIGIGNPFTDSGGDDMSDFSIVEQVGLRMETHHDAVPAARCIGGPYYGRMLAASSATYPNRIWWTPVNQPWYWPRENYLDLGDRADEFYAITIHQGQARFYGKRSISVLRGDPDSGIASTAKGIGLIGMKAIDSDGPYDYFQGMEGVYRNDGDQAQRVGGVKIDPLFRPLTMPPGADPDLLPLNGSETLRAKNCLAVKNGRLFFSYVNSTGSVPNQMLQCNLATGDWTAENAPSPSQPASYTALHYEGQASELLGAGPLGIIYALEYPLPETNPIPHRWTSGFYNPGTRDQKARFADLVIGHSCKRSAGTPRNLTVKLKLDNTDTADYAAGSIPVATTGTGANRLVTVLPLGSGGKGLHARNIALLAEGDCEHEVSIYSASIHYWLEPRDALLFDSGATMLGDPRVKTCDLLDLVIWNQGTVTWEVLTDLPGDVLTQRATGTFAAVTDRTPIPIGLTGCDGRLVQVRLTSPSPFWLYRAAVRSYVVTYYLSGANKTLTLPGGAVNL